MNLSCIGIARYTGLLEILARVTASVTGTVPQHWDQQCHQQLAQQDSFLQVTCSDLLWLSLALLWSLV